ncbi:DUF6192 family protein [Streptomyces sp. NPDC051956]
MTTCLPRRPDIAFVPCRGVARYQVNDAQVEHGRQAREHVKEPAASP